jgi:hypothetical protein
MDHDSSPRARCLPESFHILDVFRVEKLRAVSEHRFAEIHAAENVDDGPCVRKLDALPDPSVLGAEITNSSRLPS